MKQVAMVLAILLLLVLSALVYTNTRLALRAEARIRSLEATHAEHLLAMRARLAALSGELDAVAGSLAAQGQGTQSSLALVQRSLSDLSRAQTLLRERLADIGGSPETPLTPAPTPARLAAEGDLRLQRARQDGAASYAAGRYREARERSAQVLEAQPQDPQARLLHGLSLYHENPADSDALAEVESELLEFARGPGADPRALRVLGRVAMERGLWDQGRDRFARAIALEPGLPEDAMALGFCLLQADDAAAAARAFDQACGLAPDSVEAWHQAGLARVRSGEREAALERFLRCVSLDASFAAARLRAGGLLAELGRCPEAVKLLEPMQRHPDAATIAGDCHERLGDASAARSAWLQALESIREDTDSDRLRVAGLYARLARSAWSSGAYADCASYCGQGLKRGADPVLQELLAAASLAAAPVGGRR